MKYRVTLNGKVYEVVVENGEAVLEAEYEAVAPVSVSSANPVVAAPKPSEPSSQAVAGKGEVISAPFPGSVVKILKKTGDRVKSGDVILIIEAMKMENEISAPKDGTVTALYVSGGQSVEKGTALVSIA